MRETQLSGRQIVMVVLVVVILMSGFGAYVSVVLPSTVDPAESKQSAYVSGAIAALATVLFGKLAFDAVRDKRRGIERGPAKISGRFDLIFGGLIALGGIVCSAITYWSANAGGGATWTLYWGMVAWGVIQMGVGWQKLGAPRE